MFCVCFVLLWPSVFARLLCIISVLASVFLFVVFGPVFSVFYLCLLCVRSSLFFLGFFHSFVLSAFACFSPAFFSPVRSSCCVLCVSFPCCVLFVGFLCSFSSSGSLGFLSVPWSSSSSSLVRPPPSSWRPFFLWLYS